MVTLISVVQAFNILKEGLDYFQSFSLKGGVIFTIEANYFRPSPHVKGVVVSIENQFFVKTLCKGLVGGRFYRSMV